MTLKTWAKKKWEEHKVESAKKKVLAKEIREERRKAYHEEYKKEAIKVSAERGKYAARNPPLKVLGRNLSSIGQGLGRMGTGMISDTKKGTLLSPTSKTVKIAPEYRTIYKKKGKHYVKVRKKVQKTSVPMQSTPRVSDPMQEMRDSFKNLRF